MKNVAVVVLDGFAPFELGVACEVFGIDRTDDGLPAYDFAVVAGEPGTLRSEAGFTLQTDSGLERLRAADLVIVPAHADHRCDRGDWPPALLAALRDVVDRGARVLSICSGAYILGAAGLLDGRSCTTHWRKARELAVMYPAAKIDPKVLYVDAGEIITSAGTAAGIDACLHLVRKEQGGRVANAIARRMVVPPQRDGGQAQFVERPVAEPACDTLAEVLEWMVRHLDQQVSVGPAGRAGGDVASYLRPAVRAGNRDYAAALAHRAADPARRAASGGQRPDGRRDRRQSGLRQRDGAAAPLPGLAGDDPARLPQAVPGKLGVVVRQITIGLRREVRLQSMDFSGRSPSKVLMCVQGSSIRLVLA